MSAEAKDLVRAMPRPSEGAALLAVISRAAADPAVDVQKMQQLLDMHRALESRQQELKFNKAMSAAQSEMGQVGVDAKNDQTKSKYASYAKLDSAVRPIYTKHGFALSFDEGESQHPEHVRVLCYVSHNAGFSRTYKADMPADGKGAKGGDVMTKTHATGAAKAYGKRYLLKDIFNIAVGEEDTDGNMPGDCISAKQAADVRAMLTEVNAREDSFLRTIKASSIETIRAAAFPTVIGILEAKRRSKND